MGNYISSKKKGISGDIGLPLLQFDSSFYENLSTSQVKNYIELLKNEVTECIKKNDTLDKKMWELNENYKTNIYTLNEQINLINKDLKTLLHNDKCLLGKFNSIPTNSINKIPPREVIKNTEHECLQFDDSYKNGNSSIMSEASNIDDDIDNIDDIDDSPGSQFQSDYVSYSDTSIFK